MRTERQAVTVKDLIEEAKKRIVFLIICLFGLSYLMSLTSSSVLVNLPAAAFFIVILRYFSLDFEMRRKAAAYKSKPSPANLSSQRKPLESRKVAIDKSDWRRKVNSPVVEDSIDQFTRHLVSEWVTDLWYSRITPDRQGPGELVQIINSVLGEISCRVRNINLIDLLTRDIINLICTHLELFRASQAKIDKHWLRSMTLEHRDIELKSMLAADNKLHPALFSTEAEHKVLQHIMDGLISLTFKLEDLQCSLFHYIVRELLACVVMRPVLNLASPRFINEKIESLVLSLSKADKGATAAKVASHSKTNGSSKISTDRFTSIGDPSVNGVELVQLKNDQSKTTAEKPSTDNVNGMRLSKDPLLSIDTRSTHSWNTLPSESNSGDGGGIQGHHSGEEWGDMLDLLSRRKTEGLAPEHFENMWAKGKNYKKQDVSQLTNPTPRNSSAGLSKTVDRSTAMSSHIEKDNGAIKPSSLESNEWCAAEKLSPHSDLNKSGCHPVASYEEDEECNNMHLDEVESGSISNYTTEDEETSSITGLDSPGVKVWDAKNNRNQSLSHIHHPLESLEGRKTRKTGKGRVHFQQLARTQSARKGSRLSSQKVHVWQEVERTTLVSGDGQDILNYSNGNVKSEKSSDDSDAEMSGRIRSGATASSSTSSISTPESHGLTANPPKDSLLTDSFWRLRCEVLSANIVKSGSKTFAVYSISVMDVNNNSWSIKRRFRHFEELHWRLKEFPEYTLHLPPKYFLSTGLDVPVILERCKLLDMYLKKLLQLPTISGSLEVWDFLSVDSQTYVFSNSLSIIETLSDDTAREKSKEVVNTLLINTMGTESKKSASQMKHNFVADGSRSSTKSEALSPPKKLTKEYVKPIENSSSDSDNVLQKNTFSTRNLGKTVKVGDVDDLHASSELLIDDAADPTLPSEWVPPNLSVPILDLVDVIFQLKDGGWIRRKAFWVAKQVLQLGMGDAFDDWLIEKIQLLRRGSVVASGIRRVEQILWPDGIFITKHPKRQRPTLSASPSQSSPHAGPPPAVSSPKTQDIQKLDEMQQKEAERRAKFVYELMIDNAPATIVSLFGRKEYEQCAKDLYYFIQSSVCLKQLAFDLLELLLLSAFPEMDYAFRQLQDEKETFGEFKPS